MLVFFFIVLIILGSLIVLLAATTAQLQIINFEIKDNKKNDGTYIKKYLEDNNINYNEYHNTDNINAPYLIEIKREN